MSDKKAFYLTTTLPYVNDKPHIGHALEFIQADALARYWRLAGYEVFFSTGTDEHGQKIYGKAQESGEDVQAYVDRYAAQFREMTGAFNLSNDAFIRTTDEKHINAAQEMWRRCEAKGDIYKKTYKGLYCVGDEMFLKESDLVDGKCPNHPNMEPVEIEEENYFFALSKYQDKLVEYLSREDAVIPGWRREEALNFVKAGLEDFSISREAKRMNWGIPVPGDESQVMYVWFDALTNYISTLDWPDGENFKKFWQDGVVHQVAGKDQVRFQSIMWQAMLMSADVKTTDHVIYHGFITSGGQKMSKSLGNVISPFDLVERYGTDATRYLLLRHVHPFEDTDITHERLDEWYNANLVNGLGNLVARVMTMAETYGVSWEDYLGAGNISDNFHGWPGVPDSNLQKYNLAAVLDSIWEKVSALDEYIQREQPFKKIKINPDEAKNDVAYLTSHLLRLSVELKPFMPTTAHTIEEAVRANKKPENLFARKE